MGLVTAYEDVNNHSLNQVSWETLQNIQTQTQMARLDYIESIDTRDWQKNIIFFANNGYDVIVTVGANLSEATIEVAIEYPSILFIGIDQQLDEVYENIATIHFAEEQAGFLAGVLATKITESGKVGAVCETSGIDSVWRYCEGFRAGAQHENNDVQVFVVYRDDESQDKIFNDPVWGEEQVLRLIDNGVDTVTGFGGNTAEGAFLAASEKDILVIGSEEDLYFQLPDIQPQLITSIIKDPGQALAFLVVQASHREILAGKYAGQITYTPLRGPSQDLENDAEEVLQGIRNGIFEIELPDKK